MNIMRLLLVVFMVVITACNSEADSKTNSGETIGRHQKYPDLLKGIKNYGESSASIRIETKDKKIIYIDPVDVNEKNDADLIFITNTHGDRFNPKTLKKIKKKNTKIMITADFYNAVTALFKKENITNVKPGKRYKVDGIRFETVVAYNLRKPGREIQHSRYNNWVGYIIYFDERSIYISGGTDALEELCKIKADIAFLAITHDDYLMSGDEGAELANKIKPKIVVPYHTEKKSELDKFFKRLDESIMAAQYGKNGKIINIVNKK